MYCRILCVDGKRDPADVVDVHSPHRSASPSCHQMLPEVSSTVQQREQVPGSWPNGKRSFPIVSSLPIRSVLGRNPACRLAAVCTGGIQRCYCVLGRRRYFASRCPDLPFRSPLPVVGAKPRSQLRSHRYFDLSTRILGMRSSSHYHQTKSARQLLSKDPKLRVFCPLLVQPLWSPRLRWERVPP
jgi:hypothetical protein